MKEKNKEKKLHFKKERKKEKTIKVNMKS